MKKTLKKPQFNTRTYFLLFLIVAVIQIICVMIMGFRIRGKILNNIEDDYHKVDSVYAAMFASGHDIIYAQDKESYVALIDSDGNIISKAEKTNVSVPGENIFTYLAKGKVYDISQEEASSKIKSGSEGRFEIYNGNQAKMVIYTPVQGMDNYLVRIVPKKFFLEGRSAYSSAINHCEFIVAFFATIMAIIMVFFGRYVAAIEDTNARHDLIAEDNDLISFTYHSSIACFEMTGAVNKIFGDEIGKRSQVDWSTFSTVLHPDDQSLLRNMSKAIKKGDVRYTTEFRIASPDGEYHWYRMNGKSMFGEDGEVTKFVGTIQNSDDQITHENMLKNRAEHDLLTGLLNKVTFEEAVTKAIESSNHNMYAFYIVDLDNFKAVNDNLGHAVGDRVLVDVASKLQRVFNEADYIGRLGGDEFAVLLVIPSMMTSQAGKLTREKAMLVNEMLCAEYGDDKITINVSASIGIAMCPDDGKDFQTLYQHADRGLYHSKEHGKNQYTFYSES